MPSVITNFSISREFVDSEFKFSSAVCYFRVEDAAVLSAHYQRGNFYKSWYLNIDI